jgi:multiple antibiotic resistance protein
MSWRAYGETTVTLVLIMDPLGNAPVFVAMTRGRPRAEVRRLAVSAVAAAAALIIGFALFGDAVLRYLHVSLDSLTIAGGLLLLLVALEMLRGDDMSVSSAETTLLVPLATPLLAGPGAIATAMVLARQNDDGGGRAAVLAGIVTAVVVVGVTLLVAERVASAIRPSIVHFLTRVVGLLLAAIAVQLVTDGVLGIIDSQST